MSYTAIVANGALGAAAAMNFTNLLAAGGATSSASACGSEYAFGAKPIVTAGGHSSDFPMARLFAASSTILLSPSTSGGSPSTGGASSAGGAGSGGGGDGGPRRVDPRLRSYLAKLIRSGKFVDDEYVPALIEMLDEFTEIVNKALSRDPSGVIDRKAKEALREILKDERFVKLVRKELAVQCIVAKSSSDLAHIEMDEEAARNLKLIEEHGLWCGTTVINIAFGGRPVKVKEITPKCLLVFDGDDFPRSPERFRVHSAKSLGKEMEEAVATLDADIRTPEELRAALEKLAIGELGWNRSIDRIVNIAVGRWDSIRAVAARAALEKLAKPMFGEVGAGKVVDALEHDEKHVRAEAAKILSRVSLKEYPELAKRAYSTLLRMIREDESDYVQGEAAEAIFSRKLADPDLVLELSRSENQAVLKAVNDNMRNLPFEPPVEALINPYIRDDDRRHLKYSLARIVEEGERTSEVLERMVHDRSSRVRARASLALTRIHALYETEYPVSLYPALVEGLADPNREAWRLIVHVLQNAKDSDLLAEELRSFLKDPKTSLTHNQKAVRLQVFISLVRLGENAMKALEDLLKHDSLDIRERAAVAMARINKPRRYSKKLTPLLISAMGNRDKFIRERAAKVLVRLSHPTVVKALEKAVAGQYDEVGTTIVKRFGLMPGRKPPAILLKALEKGRPAVRREAAKWLVNFDHPLTRTTLREAMGFGDKKLNYHIVGTLASFGRKSQDAVEDIKRLIDEGMVYEVQGNHALEAIKRGWRW